MKEYTFALRLLADATTRLVSTARPMRHGADLTQPSLLPRWSKAHLLVHVARNAIALRNLLLSSRAGIPLRMYPSLATRDADIITGATRPTDVIIDDLEHASNAFLVEANAFPVDHLGVSVPFTSGPEDAPLVNATDIANLRLAEVEVHHVDLDAGYTFADTPIALAEHLVDRFMSRRALQGCRFTLVADDPECDTLTVSTAPSPVVRGARRAALAWLAGRSLSNMESEGNLPSLPPFG